MMYRKDTGRTDPSARRAGGGRNQGHYAERTGCVSLVTPIAGVHDGIVTLAGDPGSAVLGSGIVDQVRQLEGVVAVRNRFSYPSAEEPEGL